MIFQYRTLVGKCELGLGLTWDEIAQLGAIETTFAPMDDDRRMTTGRKFRREQTRLSALMRGDRIHDKVELVEVSPGGFVCRRAPYVAPGETVELVVDAGDQLLHFTARGVWLKDDGEDYRVGLALVGMPVATRVVVLTAHQADVVDQIKLAA